MEDSSEGIKICQYESAFADFGVQLFGKRRSEIRGIWEGLLAHYCKVGREERWPLTELEEVISHARQVLADLHTAIHGGQTKAAKSESFQEGCIRPELDFQRVDVLDCTPANPCRIAKDDLDEAARRYLTNPKLGCGPFDWIFLNAYLFWFLYEVAVAARFDITKPFPWLTAAIVGKGHPIRLLLVEWILRLSRFLLKWLLPPLLAAYLFYQGYFYFPLIISIGFILLFVERMLTLPSLWKERRKVERKAEMFIDLLSIKAYAAESIFSPSILHERMKAFEKKYPEVILEPTIAILRLSCKRDADLLFSDFKDFEMAKESSTEL